MELTEEKIQYLLNSMGEIAKQVRNRIPYSQTDGFAQMVIVLGPNLEPGISPVTWSHEGEKYATMRAVAKAAKETFSQAVMLIMDTRWVTEKNIRDMFNLPPLQEIGVEEFQRLYSKNLKEKYNGYLGNAPAHFYSEAIVIAMKGPMCGTRSLMLPYTKGFDDKVRWLEKKDDPTFGASKVITEIDLIPAWWS